MTLENQFIFSSEDARNKARSRMPKIMFDFVDGAAGKETGVQLNQSAFEAIKLQSRVLINIENCDLGTELLGQEYGLPFGFAPMGMCALSWPGADLILGDEAWKRKIVHCVSTASSTTMEEMKERTDELSWFQLYTGTRPEATEELIERAEAAKYETLIFTVDTPKLSRRIRDLQNGFQVPFKLGPRQILDFAMHPRWSIETLLTGVPKPMHFETSKLGKQFVRGESRGGADWQFLKKLRKRWKGKLIVKGIMSTKDAVQARKAGADAIYVSNHGGRQLDSAPAAIQVLPTIRKALGADFPIIFDSGVRSGEDIVKALALGANFVMLGRPLMFALGAGGSEGLRQLLDCFKEDLRVAMAQIGCRRIAEINASAIWEESK